MEFIHGFNSGMSQSIIGHPFDTYKTWKQVNYLNYSKTNIELIKNLYRGFSYPAFTNSIISGCAFKVYQEVKPYNIILGGICAGIITGSMSSYFEYKKITLQLNMNNTNNFKFRYIYPLLLREIPACTFYYPVYDTLITYKIHPLLAGGISGVTCWVSSYWADVINTHVVNNDYTIRQVVKKLHFFDYFKGLSICIPRAFIVNAIGYYTYEKSKEYLK
jgi:solute carrier family 25 carnitine/acylcarnitine transporter 20/29